MYKYNNDHFIIYVHEVLIMIITMSPYICNFRGGEILAERGFDPRTSGLWAQHASIAPLCFSTIVGFDFNTSVKVTFLLLCICLFNSKVVDKF